MGKFNIGYPTNESLYCIITKPKGYQKKYYLPKPEQNGYVLNVTNTFKNKLILKLNTNKANTDSLYHLKISMRSNTVLDKVLKLSELDSMMINTMPFPMGIAQIGIYNSLGQLLVERLVFVNKNKKYPFRLIGLKKQYKLKEKVNFLLNTMNMHYEEDPASFSLSVSLISSKDAPEQEKNIISSLLLEHELKGEVFTPGFYFGKHLFANQALDLLMLTQGWRKPINQQVNKELKKQPSAIQGKVVKLNGKPVKLAEVTLLNYKTFSMAKTKTDNNGLFSFSAIDYMMVADTNTIALTATGPKKSKKVKIVLVDKFQEQISKAINPKNPTDIQASFKTRQALLTYSIAKDSLLLNENKRNTDLSKDTILIEEVNVTARRFTVIPKEIYEKKYITYELNEEDIKFDISVFNMIWKAAGPFRMVSGGRILFRGYNSILTQNQQGAIIVVDGMFLGYDVGDLSSLNPDDIKSIKVTKTSAAGLRYSSFASGGLIEIKTKNGFTSEKSKKSVKSASNLAYIEGFQPYREFYSPIYVKKEDKNIICLSLYVPKFIFT